MKKTRIACLVLALLTALGVFVGCGGNTQQKPDDTVPPAATSTGDEAATNDPGLPSVDFGDENGVAREFTMLVRTSRYAYLYAQSNAVDRVEQSVYDRNEIINAQFNVEIKIKEMTKDSGSACGTMLASASGEYDLIVPDFFWLLEDQGYYVNLADRKEINMNDGYWYRGWNDNMTICGKCFTIVGDPTLEVMENLEVIYFNRARAIANGYVGENSFYSLVDNDRWTLEEMLRICTEVYDDKNDDDPGNDFYGIYHDEHSLRTSIYSSGMVLTKIADNGMIDVTARQTANSDRCDKLIDLFKSPATKYVSATARASGTAAYFLADKCMFLAQCLYVGKNQIKTSTSGLEYGIVIQPKALDTDEYSSTSYGVSVFAIPKSAKDYNFSATIMNAIGYYSKSTVVDTFYDIVMCGQVAHEPDDARMLELAREIIRFEFSFIHETSAIRVLRAATNAVLEGEGFANKMKTAAEDTQDAIEYVIENYMTME